MFGLTGATTDTPTDFITQPTDLNFDNSVGVPNFNPNCFTDFSVPPKRNSSTKAKYKDHDRRL